MKKIILSLALIFSVALTFGQSLPNIWVPTSGTDTYSTNITSFGSSYSNKIAYVKFGNTNTGAATLGINSIPSPPALRMWDGNSWEPLTAGQIDVNTIYKVTYLNGGNYWQLESFGTGGGGGSGDFVGPGSSTDNAIVRFDGTTGKLGQNSGVAIDDSNVITGGTWQGTAVGPTFGGTGQTTVTTGDLLYGSASNTWAKLAGVATGNALISGGVGTAPAWGKIALSTHISGTLPVANGGTGLSALGTSLQELRVNVGATALEYFNPTLNPMTTTGDMIYSSDNLGTPARIAGVATGNTLISGGIGTAPSWGKITLSTHVDGILPLANGGTGSALSDPGANRIFIWDDTDNAYVNGVIGSNLTYDAGTNTLSASGGGARLDQLTGATASVAINSTSFGQEWQWNSLAGSPALLLSSTSTAATSDLQRMLQISLSGTNATSTQTTWGAHVSNTHAGTASTNIGIYTGASGGASNNYALKTGPGVVLLGNAEADAIVSNTRFDVRGTGTGSESIFRFSNSAGTLRLSLTNQGALTLTNAIQNAVTFTNTFTSDATNRHSVNIAGTYTVGNTSGFVANVLLNSANVTTQNTNQILNSNLVNGTYTSNSTGAEVNGYHFNATAAGSNPPALNALRASSGNVVIGTQTATAYLHIKAGTATASTAPLKLTSGTNLTTPEAGAVEFDGTNYFVTSSTTRYTLAKTLTNTATLDFGSTSGGASTDLTITVTGAASGDAVYIGVPAGSVPDNGVFFGWVSAADTVTIRYANNDTLNAKDPASGTFRAVVTKY